jgi:hypothetical protein
MLGDDIKKKKFCDIKKKKFWEEIICPLSLHYLQVIKVV